MTLKKALISVYDKSELTPIVGLLHQLKVEIYSTGGTQSYIENIGIPVQSIEDLTSYPSLLDGRVKTLHPKVFGAILNRSESPQDQHELIQFDIPKFDVVIVDLYPFQQTVHAGASHEEIIEKIDIGGVSLIRAAAKNYNDVVVISSKQQYNSFIQEIQNESGATRLVYRKKMAGEAFHLTSLYDKQIANYFCADDPSLATSYPLRYGENPHQKGVFHGDLNSFFDKLNGKEYSYNNLLDIDAAVSLMHDFADQEPTFAILKHNNTCGIAMRSTIKDAYLSALNCDPISAFGGVLIANTTIDVPTAHCIDELFCEVIIAPHYEEAALNILCAKKNRIVLCQKTKKKSHTHTRAVLNGILEQDIDNAIETKKNLELKTNTPPTDREIDDLLFANKIVKHLKSNAIVLASERTLVACGVGQTSRIDALEQAICRAKLQQVDFTKVVMASDAFFPFPDCVEIANKVGIRAVIQPGGSIKDQLSIDYCNANNMAMVFTGVRHFKH